MTWRGVVTEFRDRLDIEEDVAAVSLLEGNTPLIEARRLGREIGITGKLFLKYEGLNPTGSFKDRGMTVAVSVAVAEGAKAVICASTGNTSASAAAYAACAGIRAFVVIPEGKVALGKLSQAVAHGAKVVTIEGSFDRALEIVAEIANSNNLAVVNSINPYRLMGQKTASFEICDVLGRAPDYHCLPVGNAGNITAYWMGYTDHKKSGAIDSLPKMMGFQAEGAAPIVRGEVVTHPETVATAIRIGNPASWKKAEAARDESGGVIEAVTDEEILEAYGQLAATEGVFVEPASAASVAGLKKLVQSKRVELDGVFVCTLTGHGLKDPATATSQSPSPIKALATIESVRAVLEI